MKIVRIEAFLLAYSLPEPMANSIVVFRRREAMLLRLTTDTGIVGWGESVASVHATAAYVRARLAPIVLGQDPAGTGRLYSRMTATLGYDRRGVAMMAVSAVDMALHDAAARERGVPVSALLGGALREEVFTYGSGPFLKVCTDPYEAMPEETEVLLRHGYRALKPRGGADPRGDGAAFSAMRRQVGPDIALMVDINQGYTARAAIEAAKRMQAAELLWIEEPVPPDDITGYQAVSAAVDVAISGGEALGSLPGYREFLCAGTFSIVQPDLAVCGGFTGMSRVAALADAFGVPVMPHVFGTVVNHHAALQMAAVLPAKRGGGPAPFPYMEVDVTYNPLLALLGPIQPRSDGTLAALDAPGLGFELDPARLEPWITGRWCEELP